MLKKCMLRFGAYIFLLLCTALTVAAQDQTLAAEDILAEFYAAYDAGDYEAAAAFFAEDAVVTLMPSALNPPIVGREDIQAWFEELEAVNFAITYELEQVFGDDIVIAAETSTSDFTQQLGIDAFTATGIYVIRDGQILTYTWVMSPESLAVLQAATAEAG